MTICIAAVAESGKYIVVAADRMFTISHPLNVEFEPPISKITEMSDHCVALGAGNGLWVDEIQRRAMATYHNAIAANTAQIVTAVKDAYSSFRDEKIEEVLIRQNLGPDFTQFRQRNGTLPQYLQPQANIYQQLFVQMNQFNLGVELIVAGLDDTGAHLNFIGHPGQVTCFDKIGYNAIGSGATHAAIRFALGLQHPKLSLPEALFAVYAAKVASEVAPGVGHETEMSVISQDGIWCAPNQMLERLQTMRAEEQKRSTPDVGEIGKLYDELHKDAGVH